MMRPRRKLLARLGDVNAPVYGGGIVYETTEGGRKVVEVEYTRGTEAESEVHGGKRAELYRRQVEDDVTADLSWADCDRVAATYGLSGKELREDGRSPNPVKRAEVYLLIAGYYGWDELDSYPVVLTEGELAKRWRFR